MSGGDIIVETVRWGGAMGCETVRGWMGAGGNKSWSVNEYINKNEEKLLKRNNGVIPQKSGWC